MTPRPDDWFEGTCAVCGEHGRFVRDRIPIGASYLCASCGASLRYHGQARVIVQQYTRHGATSLAALVNEPEFQKLRIWEPGELGPFRAYLRDLPGYEVSSYWPDVAPGSERDGVRCEDLMALTFPAESFDLVITSDVFEHVRRPYVAFREMHRVLKPGGAHIFSVPMFWPLREHTIERVDTSGDEDVMLLEPKYHRIHLVYNDFGADLVDHLVAIGFDTDVVRFATDNEAAAKLVTVRSVKPAAAD